MRFIILSIALLSILFVNSCGDGSQDAAHEEAIKPDPTTAIDPLPTSTPLQTATETPVTTVSPVNTPTPIIESSNTHTVKVIHHEYVPRDITIKQGDTVEWIMVNAGHTVTSGEDGTYNGLFDSGDRARIGTKFSVKFDSTFVSQAGVLNNVFEYYCKPHWRHMKMGGTITVEP